MYYKNVNNKERMANNLPFGTKVLAVSMLAEGSGIRSVERTTGIHGDTVMRLGVPVGETCGRVHDENRPILALFYRELSKNLRFKLAHYPAGGGVLMETTRVGTRGQ